MKATRDRLWSCREHSRYRAGCPDCRAKRRSQTLLYRAALAAVVPPARLAKDEALCCLGTMDDHGRMTPGFCGPDCLRRPTGGGGS